MRYTEKHALIRKLVKTHLENRKPLTQVDRIILLFGGITKLQEALRAVDRPRAKATIYRWNHLRTPTRRGSNGVIPNSALHDIEAAARFAGVLLTSEHLDPRPTKGESIAEMIQTAQESVEDPV